MITAEHWMEGINSVLDEYGLSREEFWKDPKAFLDNLDDMDAKLTLEYFKKVYSMLDKGLFIEKMNNMIKDYGNLIIDLNNPNDLSYNIYSTTRIDWDNKSDSF